LGDLWGLLEHQRHVQPLCSLQRSASFVKSEHGRGSPSQPSSEVELTLEPMVYWQAALIRAATGADGATAPGRPGAAPGSLRRVRGRGARAATETVGANADVEIARVACPGRGSAIHRRGGAIGAKLERAQKAFAAGLAETSFQRVPSDGAEVCTGAGLEEGRTRAVVASRTRDDGERQANEQCKGQKSQLLNHALSSAIPRAQLLKK
jgi:hypothetical protein